VARQCTVCTHPNQGKIDEALVSGTAIRDIAGQHGLAKSAVDRHSTHIGTALVQAAQRKAELETLAAATDGTAGSAAVRELLALQASDWAFMVSRGLAVPYARERFDGHRAALARALADGPDASEEGLRNLAAHADPSLLLAP